jgi:hypothetical protein
MNAVGQWVVTPKTTFTAVTSLTADDVFTADFESYLLVVRYATSGAFGINIQLRASGVAATTNYNRQDISIASTTSTITRSTAQSSFANVMPSTEGVISTSRIFINGPQLAEPTSLFATVARNVSNDYAQPVILLSSQNHSTASAFDGFSFATGGGTFTGNFTLYGLRP